VGAHDELTPACAETLRAGIPDSRVVQFDDSSHTAHIEETTRYLDVVGAFLHEVESLTA
jgi:pimeloyl-ACP methyl ester carboxylesterase